MPLGGRIPNGCLGNRAALPAPAHPHYMSASQKLQGTRGVSVAQSKTQEVSAALPPGRAVWKALRLAAGRSQPPVGREIRKRCAGLPAHIAHVPLVRSTLPSWPLLNSEISLHTSNSLKSQSPRWSPGGAASGSGAVCFPVASVTSSPAGPSAHRVHPLSTVQFHLPEGLEA